MDKIEKVYIMNEVAIPGIEFGVKADEEVCVKCGKLKKTCVCK